MRLQIRTNVLTLVTVLIGVAWQPANAQNYPSRPITIVVPYAAGGPTDITARRLAELMHKEIGATVLVENRPGAATTLAAAYVARAPKDGYTLIMAPGTLTSINPHVFRSLPYRTEDFAPISLVSKQPFAFTASNTLPAKTVAEFVAYGKAKTDGISFGTTGTGSMTHIIGEWIGRTLGVKMVEIPYKGTSASTVDLAAGRLDTQVEGIGSGSAVHKSGKARVVAVMSDERSPVLPDVPTFKETGFPDLQAFTYFGLLAPAGTSKPVIDKLHAAVVNAVASPDFVAKLKFTGEIAASSPSPEKYGELLEAEYQHWAHIIKPLNLKLDQ